MLIATLSIFVYKRSPLHDHNREPCEGWLSQQTFNHNQVAPAWSGAQKPSWWVTCTTLLFKLTWCESLSVGLAAPSIAPSHVNCPSPLVPRLRLLHLNLKTANTAARALQATYTVTSQRTCAHACTHTHTQ